MKKAIDRPLMIGIAIVAALAIATLVVVITHHSTTTPTASGTSSSASSTTPSHETTSSATQSSSSSAKTSAKSTAPGGVGNYAGDPAGAVAGYTRLPSTKLGISFDYPSDWDSLGSTTFNSGIDAVGLANTVALPGCNGKSQPMLVGLMASNKSDPAGAIDEAITDFAKVSYSGGSITATPGTPAGSQITSSSGGIAGDTDTLTATLSVKDECGASAETVAGFAFVAPATEKVWVLVAAYVDSTDDSSINPADFTNTWGQIAASVRPS